MYQVPTQERRSASHASTQWFTLLVVVIVTIIGYYAVNHVFSNNDRIGRRWVAQHCQWVDELHASNGATVKFGYYVCPNSK